MTLQADIRRGLQVKQAQANEASAQFDFESEGGLATFFRQATPGTTYWRGYLPMKHLPGNVAGIEPDSLVLESEDPLKLRMPQLVGDTAIWQFLGDEGRGRIVFQMQRQGTRTLMEVDDNYLTFAPPLYGKFSSWTKTHKEAVENGTGYSVEFHRLQTPMVDGVICATEHLANAYEAFNDHVYHCPNSVDPDDWDIERTESENLRIGYYGSTSHLKDWPLVKKSLKWAQRQPGVEVILIGFNPPGWSGKVYPWSDDLYEARKPLGHLDVGIAPLTRNKWSDGKSDVKAMEYAMAGVMPIVHDAPPYSPWKDMGWEWMPKDELGWSDAIHDIVEMRDDVKMFAAQAKEYVLNYRTIQNNVHLWKEAIRG